MRPYAVMPITAAPQALGVINNESRCCLRTDFFPLCRVQKVPFLVKGHVMMWICFCHVFLLAAHGTLHQKETVIIALATVSVLVVVAATAFFGYRMMHSKLPWSQAMKKSAKHRFYFILYIFFFVSGQLNAFFVAFKF